MPNLDDLRMPSLSTDQLLESVRKNGQNPEDPDPRDNEEYTFYFDYTNRRKQRFEGKFTNRILTIEQTQQVHILKARMLQSVPMTALSEEMLATSQIVAHMTVSLDHKVEWAKDLRALRDPSVLWRLWSYVEGHESRYFRVDENSAGSEE